MCRRHLALPHILLVKRDRRPLSAAAARNGADCVAAAADARTRGSHRLGGARNGGTGGSQRLGGAGNRAEGGEGGGGEGGGAGGNMKRRPQTAQSVP